MEFFVTFAAFQPWQELIGLFSRFLEWLFELTLKMGVPSYVLAVLMFTIMVKLITQPLTNKQMRSSRRMQQLTPEINAIKQRYATNPQKQQQATMDLYKQYNVKPTAGCLPLLIQFPILIALYQGIYRLATNGVAHPEYLNIDWFGSVVALTEKDPTGWMMPILCALATFGQQWFSTTNRQDKTQKYMLIAMPLMFLFMVRGFPLMMGFYWVFYSVIGTLIFLPFRLKWDKEDKLEAEARRLSLAQEEEERRRKKETMRAQAQLKSEERRKKAALKRGEQVEMPTNYFSMLDDPDYYDEDLDDEQLETEKQFRSWLRGQGVVKVKDKKVRLHPWSTEDEVVTVCVMTNGTELELSGMQERYKKVLQEQQAAQTAEALMSKFKRKKDKRDFDRSPDGR